MVRTISILSLLIAVLSVSFLAGCQSTDSSKPYGMSGQGTKIVNDKGRVVGYTNQ